MESDSSDIDNEIDRMIEEQSHHYYDDVSDFSETQSVMSIQSISKREDYIPPDTDLDQYLEDLLKNKNKRMLKKMELVQEQKLHQLKYENAEEVKIVLNDQALQDLNDLRQLNQINLNDLIGQDDDTLSMKSMQSIQTNSQQYFEESQKKPKPLKIKKVKVDFNFQIRLARENAAKQVKLAEEELLEQFLKDEEHRKIQDFAIKEKAKEQKVQRQKEQAVPKVQFKPEQPEKQSCQKLQKPKPQTYEDAYLEIERMLMVREDARSLQVEKASHQVRFEGRNLPPPSLPNVFVQLGLNGSEQEQKQGPFAYITTQLLTKPQEPTSDSYWKYECKLKLPKHLDLQSQDIKVLWSKEKETAEQEQRRKDEIALKLKNQKLELTKLVQFGIAQKQKSQVVKDDSSLKQSIEKVQSICKLQIPDQKTQTNQLKRQKIDLNLETQSKLSQRHQDKDIQKFEIILKSMHSQMVADVSFTIAAISKLLPTSATEFDEFILDKTFIKPPAADVSAGVFEQALELNASEGHQSRRVEVKNENLASIDVTSLYPYHHNLIHLDLSMNKIATIHGTIDCPNLKRLLMSDNLLKEISPFLLQKCAKLKVLNLDINQISRIANLQNLTNLMELSMQNNKISIIEGLTSLTKLRKVNLSFNLIKKLEGIMTLQLLEFLELGKNQIESVEALQSPNNKLVFLSELYLYMNKIKSLPKLSLAQLKYLNLNRNDLKSLQLGYCPLLEIITVSNCQLEDIFTFQYCPSLKEVDVSFNLIPNLPNVLSALQYNDVNQMKSLSFNDNKFNQVLNDEQQAIQASLNLAQQTHSKQFNMLLLKVFPMLERLNGQYLQRGSKSQRVVHKTLKIDQQLANLLQTITQVTNYRNFVTKQLSQKLFITFSSNTPLMQLMKSVMPIKILQRLFNPQNENTCNILQDSLFYQNFCDVNKKRQIVQKCVSLFKSKKIRRSALLQRIGQNPNYMSKLTKLQAAIRGHLSRVKNYAAIKKIRLQARRKTKGFIMATKIQSVFRGYLFRNKRKRALAKLKTKPKEGDVQDDIFMQEGDFDADLFLDIKMENLEQADIFAGANAGLMEKYIQVLSNDYQYQHPNQMLGASRQVGENMMGSFLPPVNSFGAKLKPKTYFEGKKSFDQNKAKDYFNAAGIAGTESRRNIQQMLDQDGLESDTRSMSAQKVMQNNLMGSHTAEMYKNQMTSSQGYKYNRNMIQDLSETQSMMSSQHSAQAKNPFYPKGLDQLSQNISKSNQVSKEEKKKQIAEEWGFEKEETMMLWEARQKKKNAGKKKNVVLTADEKLKRFQNMAKPPVQRR